MAYNAEANIREQRAGDDWRRPHGGDVMRPVSRMVLSASALLVSTSLAWADMQGTGESGGWEKRVAVKPDPSKVVVPDGYEVGVLVEGLNAPSAATVDGDGNLWVVVSPPLLGLARGRGI